LKARVEHADRCFAWERKQRNHRQEEKEEKRTKRYDEVVARLEALGWGEELTTYKDWYEGIQSLPPMNSTKLVTDRVWDTCKERILQFMRTQQDRRIEVERTKTIKSRYQEIEKIVSVYQRTHHPREFFVSTPDVCKSPGVSESIICSSDKAFEECLAGISDLIPEVHDQSLKKRQGELLKLLPEGSAADDLTLAVSWFRCRYCGESFHHSWAIKHSCCMFRMWGTKSEEVKVMEPFDQVYQLCGRGMWLADRLAHWKDAAELTKQVIEATGMDPTKVTPDELDGANLRFVVFTGPDSSTMTIVGWRCLVTGRCEKSSGKRTTSEWRLMKPEEMPEFKHPSLCLEKNDWACLHCWKNNETPFKDTSWALVKSHLKDKHDIEKPTEDDYHCKKPNLQYDYFLKQAPAM